MFLELVLPSLAGVLSAILFAYLFFWKERARLYSLEEQVALLEQRHLSAVRRQAINKRWDEDESLDNAVELALGKATVPEKRKWKKWDSENSSRNLENPQQKLPS